MQSYRSKLESNHFTRNWSTVLRLGVIAQGVVVGLLGCAVFLFVNAGYRVVPRRADPDLQRLSDPVS